MVCAQYFILLALLWAAAAALVDVQMHPWTLCDEAETALIPIVVSCGTTVLCDSHQA